jgi:hypothetical protein
MNRTPNLLAGKGEAMPFATLPLFAWAARHGSVPVQPTAHLISEPPARAAAIIARRFGISPTFAALAARHSGFGGYDQ